MSAIIYVLTVLFVAYVIYEIKGDQLKTFIKKYVSPLRTNK